MTYVIEMLWACSSCGRKDIPGLTEVCPGCFRQKDADDHEYMPADTTENAAIRNAGYEDSVRFQRAHLGPDWVCPTCTTRVRADVEACPECAHRHETRKEVPAHDQPPRQQSSSNFKLVLVIVVIALFSCIVGYFLFRTRVVDAKVVSLQWEHSVLVDRYSIHRHDGWTPPANAVAIRDEGRRVHHHERVLVGTHQEPYNDPYECGRDCRDVPRVCHDVAPTCRSNGNGTATCSGGGQRCSGGGQSCTTRYCNRTLYRTVNDYKNEPRYATWYSWGEWQWAYNRTVKHHGTTTTTTWPTDAELTPSYLPVGEKERTRRSADYTVVFADNKDTFNFKPNSTPEFASFSIGMPRRLRVGIAHGVEILRE